MLVYKNVTYFCILITYATTWLNLFTSSNSSFYGVFGVFYTYDQNHNEISPYTWIRMATIKKKHKKPKTASVNKDVVKLKPLYTFDGNAKWCSLWIKVCKFIRKLKIELPHDLAISLLGIYPKGLKSGYWRDISTSHDVETI